MAAPSQTVVVIGGGFYGASLAVWLRQHFPKVILFERESRLMTRASRVNQARLHNGYHYPRSFLTAARSHANLVAFREKYPEAVEAGFRHIYGIARNDSKVGRRHFEQLFKTIGVPLRPPPEAVTRLFNPRLLEAVYEVEEPAFNIDPLRETVARQLADSNVDVRLGVDISAIIPDTNGQFVTETTTGLTETADWVFNCTYTALNRLLPQGDAPAPALAHQLTEITLVEPPEELRDLGVTVMDGPFFSIMPFPSEHLHSLTHVRYTPHVSWTEHAQPDRMLGMGGMGWNGPSRFEWMMRDAARYLPAVAKVRHVRSLYDTKTLLHGMQMDDSRPILFHQDSRHPRLVSILGAKIDNIFDVFVYVERALKQS